MILSKGWFMAPRKSVVADEVSADTEDSSSVSSSVYGYKRADRTVRTLRPDKLGSITTYRWLDILDEAYQNGFIGFSSVELVPHTTIARDGNAQTTYIATVVAEFYDIDTGERSQHVGAGEANYENCNKQIGNSAARMAETRAKSRALAHALNLDANVDFEMADPTDPSASAIPNSRTSPNGRAASSAPSISRIPSANPETYPPQNIPDGWACEVCGSELKSSEKYTAGQKASWSVRDHGQILCYEHNQAAKAAKAAA
jgi:hypothetical protein